MSYGFEFRDAAGVPRLKITEALSRIIHAQRFAASFSGSITVPNFSTDTGMFYYAPCVIKLRLSPSFLRWPDSMALNSLSTSPGINTGYFAANAFGLPTLSWNESTKTMTIAPANLPSNWPTSPYPYVGPNSSNPDYWIVFLQSNLRFEVT